jgi:predicted acyltransferase
MRRRKGESAAPGWTMPLLVFGTNSIFAYVLSELLSAALYSFPIHRGVYLVTPAYSAALRTLHDPAMVSLLYSLAFVAVCWLPTYVLFRKRIFLKI